MSYLKDREVWLEKTPTGNPPAGYYWKFIQDGVVVVRDSDGVDRKMAIDSEKAPIQDTDTWVLTTSFTGSVNPIATNLARFTHTDYIGTGMSVASGRFTFPRTGIWRVELHAYTSSSVVSNYTGGLIKVVTDASGTPVVTTRAEKYDTVDVDGGVTVVLNGLEVTSVADIKVEFQVVAEKAGMTWQGASFIFRTGMIFTRIGDL